MLRKEYVEIQGQRETEKYYLTDRPREIYINLACAKGCGMIRIVRTGDRDESEIDPNRIA